MKKYFKYLVVILLCITFTCTKVRAKSFINELFQAGDTIKVEEKLDGTAFIAGNKVDIKNTIDGIGFVAANELTINNEQEYIFGAGTIIDLEATIKKDLFLAGETVKINNSIIERDSYIFADSVTLNSTFNRNIYIYGNNVDIKGNINGNVTVLATKINIDRDTKILGTLKYNEDATINDIGKDIKTKTYKYQENTITFKEYLSNFINSYIHITILAIVIIFINENILKKSLEQTKEKSLKNIISLCGKGLLILIGVPILALMLLFTGAFISVGVIGALIYGILVYISNIFTGYYVATILDKKFLKRNMNGYLLVIFGLFIIYIISIIPIIGSFISFISMILGLGILGNMIIELKK